MASATSSAPYPVVSGSYPATSGTATSCRRAICPSPTLTGRAFLSPHRHHCVDADLALRGDDAEGRGREASLLEQPRGGGDHPSTRPCALCVPCSGHRTSPTVVFMFSEHVHRGATRNDRTSGRRSRFSSAPFQGWKSGDEHRAVRRCRGRSRRPTGARKPPVRGPGQASGAEPVEPRTTSWGRTTTKVREGRRDSSPPLSAARTAARARAGTAWRMVVSGGFVRADQNTSS